MTPQGSTLREKWLALAEQQMQWAKDCDDRQDGANSHTCRGRARIYRECAADLDTLLASSAGSGWQPSGTTVFRDGDCRAATGMTPLNAIGRTPEWRENAFAGWRDIETAPKDREILTYRKSGQISVAAYFPHGEAEWCCTDGCHILSVTHWMPLPAPPSAGSGSQPAADEPTTDLGAALLPVDPSAAVSTEPLPIEVRMAGGADVRRIDEIVASNAGVHLEQMSETEYTLIVETATERACYSIHACNSRSHIRATETWRDQIGSGNTATPEHAASTRRSEAK